MSGYTNIFEVRNPHYHAGDGKPDFYGACCDIVRQLVDNPPRFLDDAVLRIGPIIRQHYQDHIDFYASNDPSIRQDIAAFGSIRALEDPDNKYSQTRPGSYQQALIRNVCRDVGGDIAAGLDVTWYDPVAQREVVLTRAVPAQGGLELRHFRDTPEIFRASGKEGVEIEVAETAEHVWSECARTFRRAMTQEKGSRLAQEAAKECYWLLSHYMPYDRGSSTMTKILLAFLKERTGLETGVPRENVDLNIEALLRGKESFLQAFDSFFEPRGRQHGLAAPHFRASGSKVER